MFRYLFWSVIQRDDAVLMPWTLESKCFLEKE
jgi:hypothetical protein